MFGSLSSQVVDMFDACFDVRYRGLYRRSFAGDLGQASHSPPRPRILTNELSPRLCPTSVQRSISPAPISIDPDATGIRSDSDYAQQGLHNFDRDTKRLTVLGDGKYSAKLPLGRQLGLIANDKLRVTTSGIEQPTVRTKPGVE